ncbi:unnamed protein product [Allacma fusca]|uniref:BTB domain-containing protein n=1 Tax=Allacma fusca TaxID=39272 RepID=A0A8J2L278_9HEXA|nr:unnamed protein product [Allacma fusca]
MIENGDGDNPSQIERMIDSTLSSTSCETSSSASESEDVQEKTRISSPATRKSFSHSSLEDFRSLPQLKQRLGHLCDKKLHSDVVFHVGPNKDVVEAHRIILCSASYIFERLFYDSTQKPLIQSGKFIFNEPAYSKESFQLFVKAMYTNEFPPELSLSLSLEIFYASKKYQIIEEQTSKVLADHVDHLDEHNLIRILNRDHLNIEEVELFQYLVKWGSAQCKRRGLKTTGKNKRQMIDHMLKYIRFTTMDSMDFTDIVVPSRILEPKEILALQSHISPVYGESRASVPYNGRPRFKPRVALRRPESLTNHIISSSHLLTQSDIHIPTNKSKLRPKAKSSRKMSIGKGQDKPPSKIR